MLSLRAHNHELLAFRNAQAQAPDISSHIRDYQYTSSDLFSTSPVSSQVFPRLPTRLSNNPFQMSYNLITSVHSLPILTQHTSPQTLPRKEFKVHGFDLITHVHSLPNHTQHTNPQALPHKEFNVHGFGSLSAYEEVNWIPTDLLGRLFTRRHDFLPTLHIGSQVAVHRFPGHTILILHMTLSHKEFGVRFFQPRVVCLGVFCGLYVYFSDGSFLRVCLSLILVVPLLITFYMYHLHKSHDECPLLSCTSFLIHHSF